MTATKKRAKELARAKEERRKARQATYEAKRRRRKAILAGTIAVAMVMLLTGGFLLTKVFGDDPQPAADESAAAPELNQAEQPVASCQAPGEMTDQQQTFEAAGDGGLGGATSATFTVQTNCGDIVIAADAAAAPQTVNSMAFLASQNYFDNTLCHRVTTEGIHVLQCGDPTGTGGGDPGYVVPEENLPTTATNNYPAGTVAMANAGAGSTGSQFFIVYEDTTLPGDYTVWGTVTSGLDIVQAIAAAGTTDESTDGAPKQAVMIKNVEVAPQ